MNKLKIISLVIVLLAASVFMAAGTLTGVLQYPNTVNTLNNAILTFSLNMQGYIAGQFVVTTNPIYCYTSVGGQVVGLPDPQLSPIVTTNTASGTLVAGTYYVRITYWNNPPETETLASPEVAVNLASTGSLIIHAPILQPVAAQGYVVYISSTSGTEKTQGFVTGWGNFTQSTSLSGSGNVVPSSNVTVCSLRFNDELIPSATWYNVTIQNSGGSILAGYPAKWQLNGGSGGTINLSNGLPVWNGYSIFPTPVVQLPVNNVAQSIAGPLTLNGYSLTAASITDTGNLTVSGNETVIGTLGVTGATILSSTLAVTGTSNFTGTTTFGASSNWPNGATFNATNWAGGTGGDLNIFSAVGRNVVILGGSCFTSPCSGFDVNITAGGGQFFSGSGNGGNLNLSGGNPGGNPSNNGFVNIKSGGSTVAVNSLTCGLTAVGTSGSTVGQGCTDTGIMTLNVGGTTTDSSANVLPSTSTIDFVMCRVTTTITTAANWSVGDASSGTRFAGANTNLTAGTVQTSPAASFALFSSANQASAAKLRITTNANPGAGAIRCVIYYRQGIAPTS